MLFVMQLDVYGVSVVCQNVINAICYAIGRLRRGCCLLALKIQQRCDTSVSLQLLIFYCSLPLKNQLLHRAGIKARALIYFFVLLTRAAIQTGP